MSMSEEQIPKLLVFRESRQNDENFRAGHHCSGQVRYQAAPRPTVRRTSPLIVINCSRRPAPGLPAAGKPLTPVLPAVGAQFRSR
jgi:hypothetical protein